MRSFRDSGIFERHVTHVACGAERSPKCGSQTAVVWNQEEGKATQAVAQSVSRKATNHYSNDPNKPRFKFP